MTSFRHSNAKVDRAELANELEKASREPYATDTTITLPSGQTFETALQYELDCV